MRLPGHRPTVRRRKPGGESSGEVTEMKGLKALGVGVAAVVVLFAVPVSAVALLLAVGHDDQATNQTTTMPHMSSTGTGARGTSTTAATTAARAGANQLTILHVQRGCHVWSDGTALT